MVKQALVKFSPLMPMPWFQKSFCANETLFDREKSIGHSL